jgi:hypothetical protein
MKAFFHFKKLSRQILSGEYFFFFMNILRKLFDTIKTLSVWASTDDMLTVHVEKQHITRYNKFQQLLIDEKPHL